MEEGGVNGYGLGISGDAGRCLEQEANHTINIYKNNEIAVRRLGFYPPACFTFIPFDCRMETTFAR
jgi:hypothetical protein